MKPTQHLILTALIASSFAFYTPLRADDDEGNDHQRGGEVIGSEDLEQEIALVATADAPAGAKGKAELKATNLNGVASAILKLEIGGLAAGTYTVTTTSLADGTTQTILGTFDVADAGTVGTSGETEDGDQGEKHHADGASATTNHDKEGDDQDGESSEGEVVFGTANGVAFPADFNPLDIGAVAVSDANSVVLLNGSFTGPSTTNFAASVQLTGTAADPTASGTALVKAKVKKKALTQRFALAAKGLPAGANVTVSFNNGKSLNARTSKKGTLGLTRLPSGVAGHRLTTVEIKDANGTKLAGAHF